MPCATSPYGTGSAVRRPSSGMGYASRRRRTFRLIANCHMSCAWCDPDEASLVSVDLSIPGVVLREGVPHRVERLFMVSADAWASGAGTVTLRTFGDAWMSHDLRGYRQPGVQEENAPRLASALTGITRFLDADVVPGDTTSFGVPSEDGFDDLPDEDPDLLDSWYMFEVPRRTDRLLEQLPEGAPQFDNVTESPVNFFEVASDGTVIGYLWASAADDAAGYEPRTPMGEAALDAAVEWLGRLSEAKARGLSPTRALHELALSRADSRGALSPRVRCGRLIHWRTSRTFQGGNEAHSSGSLTDRCHHPLMSSVHGHQGGGHT